MPLNAYQLRKILLQIFTEMDEKRNHNLLNTPSTGLYHMKAQEKTIAFKFAGTDNHQSMTL